MYIPSYNPVPPQVSALQRYLAPGNDPQAAHAAQDVQAFQSQQQQNQYSLGQNLTQQQPQYDPALAAAQQAALQRGSGLFPTGPNTGLAGQNIPPQVLALANNSGLGTFGAFGAPGSPEDSYMIRPRIGVSANNAYSPNAVQAPVDTGAAQPGMQDRSLGPQDTTRYIGQPIPAQNTMQRAFGVPGYGGGAYFDPRARMATP